jgi:hypothetical protein
MALFLRDVLVNISNPETGLNQDFAGATLRIRFSIEKNTKSNSNTARVEIYNLSEYTRNLIREFDDTVTVSAGYSEGYGNKLMFKGQITKINHKKELPDIISALECGDGIKKARETRASVSYEEGSKTRDIIQDLANKLELPIKSIPDDIKESYVQGFSHTGSVKEALNKVVEKAGLEWSIQNEEIQIIKKRNVTKSPEIIISDLEGLIEQPEKLNDLEANLIGDQPKPGYRIKTLLNPDIEPGIKVFLQSPNVQVDQPEYRVEKVTHTGDNWGGDYVTEFTIVEITPPAEVILPSKTVTISRPTITG